MPGHVFQRADICFCLSRKSRTLSLTCDTWEPGAEPQPLLVQTVQNYLGGICDGIKQYAITDVQTSDRVSVLLKDSFLDSFANKDKPFMKQFMETQMFSVYSDAVIN